MIFRRVAFLVFVSFMLVRPAVAGPGVVNGMRVHWLGLKQAGADTNSALFMKVWQLPQTKALVAQTLDKLSRWPGHGVTNAASAALRPLLDDLIASEFYLELSAPTNSQFAIRNSQFLLAVRLPADRAGFWQTNLTALPQRIDFARSGDWTLVGVGLDQKISKTDFASHFAHDPAPGKVWLEADLNPSYLAAFFPTSNFPLPLSHVHLTVSANSGNLLTRATLELASPMDAPLTPWQIPTNLIHGQLTSFAAVRGIAPWLAALPTWQKLQLAPAPDQAFCWSQMGIPFQTYLAAPMPNASNQLFQLAGRIIPNANPWLATNAEGSFSWSASPPGIFWKDADILTPYLISTESDHREYLLGGLYQPSAPEPTFLPAFILEAIQHQPNLVFSGFEETGGHVDDDFFISQMSRVIFHKPQMTGAAAGTLWLKALEQFPGETTTLVTRDGPNRLVLERHSTIGFTALELHLLADWLESPQFPHGLHTFLAPPDKKP